MAKRVCSKPGCPTIHDGVGQCPRCAAESDRARGTLEQRGYGREHRRLRAAYARRMAAGERFLCAKCASLVDPRSRWDLGHTDDRTGWTGPEHAHCNRSDGGRRSGR